MQADSDVKNLKTAEQIPAMHPAKVVVDARFLGSGSGLDAYLKNLLPEVAKCLPQVQFVLLVSPNIKQKIPWLNKGRFSIRHMSCKPYTLYEQLLLLFVHKGDLFWSPHYNIPFLSSSPLLVTIHDTMHTSFYSRQMAWHQRFFIWLLMRQIVLLARGIICISSFSHNEFVWRYGEPSGHLEVIRLGVASRWFKLQSEKKVHPRPFFLFVGNLRRHKNLRNLIYAFRQIREKIEHDLIVIGSSAGRLGIDHQVLEMMHSEPGIYYKGSLPQKQTEQFFVQCDIFVFPSLYEGFGLPPLEAMACGKPVIAANSTAIYEVCGSAALYFDPLDVGDMAEKMLRMVGDSDLRRKLVEQGQIQAAQFTWQKAAQKTSKMLAWILQNNHRKR